MPQPKPLYQEKRKSWGLTVILGLVTLVLAGFLTAQLIYGPLGTKPASTWFLAAMTGFIVLVTLNFRHITLTLTKEKVAVRYGLWGTARRWSDLRTCEKDEQHAFYGWGIRFGGYKHQWVWVYNVIGGPRVAFLTGSNRPKGLIVSTTNPDEVLRVAQAQIRAAGARGSAP